MSSTIKDFITHLTRSGVMSESEITGFLQSLAVPPESGEALAKALIRTGKLTQFQAQRIYQGKYQGLILGEYLLVDRIGAGGMGQVYLADHRRMGRRVALKTLPPAVARDQQTVKRFQREVRAAAQLSHPHIVTAYDAGEAKGVHYFVMEHIQGTDLSQLIRERGALPLEQALDYTLQAAKGLEYAHHKGVIHRDIKPSNLLLDTSGTVKILDMGLARLTVEADDRTDDALTNTGAVMGTVDYMAPEQALDTRTADARADIYSLGCTLYYLLTGQPVYGGDTVIKKILAHRESPVPSLTAQRSEISPTVDSVFQKLIAKRPEDRYQNMGEVVTALQTCRVPAATLAGTEAFAPDSGLQAFLHSRELDTLAQPSPAAYQETLPSGALSATLSSDVKPAQPRRLRRRNGIPPKAWLLLGGLAVMVVLSGIIIKITNPDGSTTEIKAPEGTKKVEIEQNGNAVATVQGDHGAVPSLLAGTKAGELWDKNSLGMKFRWCPPGKFTMGSPEREGNRNEDENQVAVTLSRGFYLGQYEVTQAEWEKIMGTSIEQQRDQANKEHPLRGTGSTHPVYYVNWNEAMEFCRKLTAREHAVGRLPAGWEYTLPTEAQWEYACRAGTLTATAFGDKLESTQANFDGNHPYNGAAKGESKEQTVAVGSYRANAWDLYDMHGNVWEWCRDWYADRLPGGTDPEVTAQATARVFRGGGWGFGGGSCRSADRSRDDPGDPSSFLGFRVALVPAARPQPEAPAADLDPQRAAALAVLEAGGSVSGFTAKGNFSANKIADLPAEPLVLSSATLSRLPGPFNEVCERLGRLPSLESFTAPYSPLTDADLAHLRNLDLSNAGLGGTQVTDASALVIASWRRLRSIDLSSPQISETTCRMLGDLPELVSVKVGGDSLSDTALAELARCSRLQLLQLSGNPPITAQGIARVKSLPQLRQLLINGTNLDDRIVEVLTSARQVRVIELHQSQVTEAGARRLQQALPQAWIGHPATRLHPEEQELARWAREQRPRQIRDWYRDSAMVEPGELWPLDVLTFSSESPSSKEAHRLAKARGLSSLTWPNLKEADTAAEHLGQITTLTNLYIPSADITGAGLARLAPLTALLRFSCNQCSRLDDEALNQFPEWPGLSILELADCPISGEGLKHLERAPHLQTLSLRATKLDAAGVEHLPILPQLRRLDLSQTGIDDAAIPHLSRFTSLRKLDLKGTNITEAGIARLHEALPECAIQSDGGLVLPVKPQSASVP